MKSERISPTAHYTGFVWFANGLSAAPFATRTGRLMYNALRGPNAAARALRTATLEGMLLARHRLIDARLEQAITEGEIDQVVEVACGLSPRGWRFHARHHDALTYVEADLPDMLAHKRAILAQLGGENPHHRTVEIDALADSGARSIDAVCATLDASRGTAIVTEGLINYFPREVVTAMWARFARALARFPRGIYLSDVMLRVPQTVFERGLVHLLEAFVRGRVHMHFGTEDEAEDALDRGGFDAVVLDPRDFELGMEQIDPAGAGRVRVIEAVSRATVPA